MCWAATEAVLQDHNILIRPDRGKAKNGPDPRWRQPPLSITTVRQQPADADRAGRKSAKREVHHCARGLWRGSDQPHLAFETLEHLRELKFRTDAQGSRKELHQGFVRWQGHPESHVQDGISPIVVRRSTQSVSAVKFVDTYFTGTATIIEAVPA
jgi:glutamate synthase (NADPH/NADH) large chain